MTILDVLVWNEDSAAFVVDVLGEDVGGANLSVSVLGEAASWVAAGVNTSRCFVPCPAVRAGLGRVGFFLEFGVHAEGHRFVGGEGPQLAVGPEAQLLVLAFSHFWRVCDGFC